MKIDELKSFEDMVRLREKQPYQDTGENAQKEVQQAIQRWRDLPESVRRETPLLYWLLGSGTPPYKMDKGEAEYTDESEVEGQTCKNCQFAYLHLSNKRFICSQISGEIKPPGWCRLWKPFK